MKDKSNMVLRYAINSENPDARFKQLVDFLERSGIHRVILFNTIFLEESSIMPKEYYKENAENMKPYIEELRNMGVEVGINFLYTIGHAYYADENEFGFRRAVTIDGEKSRGCVCLRDEKFLDYIKEVYGYYAALHPSVIFTDDDIRGNSLGQIICLCSEHIRLISEKVGRKLLLEEIKKHIESDSFAEDEIRNAYFDVMENDIKFLIKTIADAVHEISPETEIGVMTTSYPTVTLDRDLSTFFDELYPKKVTRIRTGMDFYREGDLKEAPMMFSMPIIQRDMINNDMIEIQPEIENDTYGFFYKSNNVTNMQIMWCLTNGFRNMQLNLFSFVDCPADNYDEIASMFEGNKAYYGKVCELIPENSRTDGVGVYLSPKAMRVRRGTQLYESVWHKWLHIMGIPLSSSISSARCIILTGDDIAAQSDEFIDEILKKGVLIDARAAEALVFRGYGNRIGIKNISVYDGLFAGEVFTDNDINGEVRNKHNSNYVNNSLLDGTLRTVEYAGASAELSEMINHRQERACGGVTVTENEDGERFCILPFDYNVFTQFCMVNNKRKKQLIGIFEWLSKNALPIVALNEKVCVNINRFEGYNVISLFNFASDDIAQPKLRYTLDGTLKILCRNGKFCDVDYLVNGDNLIINSELRAANVMILIDEQKGFGNG